MKKTLLIISLFMSLAISGTYAQRYALIDMEYILEKIPAYESANKQIEDLSKQWQSTVDKEIEEVDAMYKKYQADLATLSASEKTKRENEIVAKENAIQELRNQYFGPQGELFKQQEMLIKPIQDNIYTAVKEIATDQGYSVVIDRASATSIILHRLVLILAIKYFLLLGY